MRLHEGLKLCNSLAYLEVQAEGDYNDYEGTPLGIWDLHERNLLTLDYKKFQKECLYLTYVGNELSERSEEMFYLFDSFVYPRVDLEDVLQFGNDELPEFALFLPMWIDYLGKRSDGTASSLLKEAQSMLSDEFALLENARRYSKEHPELYLQLLEMNKETGQADKMMEIGLEAIESVPQELTIRSKIALVTAYYADKLCRFEVRDKCWLEALRSDPTIINYMRIKFLPYDAKQYESQIAAIIQTAFEAAKNSEVRYITASENKRISLLSTNDCCVMLFFEQKFDDMEKLGMSFQGSLGWSTTFIKQGIALLFMLLHEGNSYRSGMKSMVTKAMDACSFSKEDLYLGSCEEDGKSEYEIFISFIERWKDTLNISDEEVKKWMSKLEAWTKKRVTGIMDGNKRNYYRECASMIAALGETKESLGDVGAKAVLMESYRREYSRRRAFHEELVRYGMKKR